MCVAAHSTVLLCVCSIFHSSVRLHSPFSKNISLTLLLYNFQLVNFNWEPNTQLTLDAQQSTKTCWTIFINNFPLTCFSCADIYLCFIDNLIRAQKFKAETFTHTKLQHCHFSLLFFQFLWPFQSFGHSKGHQKLMEQHLKYSIGHHQEQAEDPNAHHHNTNHNSPKVFDSKAQADSSIQFEYYVSPWTTCSQTCGSIDGYRVSNGRS